uniref:Secreted protein n=1 Tax=Cucumis melo TaxID=3656 RepID=A0A9I9EJM6_CUCME
MNKIIAKICILFISKALFCGIRRRLHFLVVATSSITPHGSDDLLLKNESRPEKASWRLRSQGTTTMNLCKI